MASPHLTWDTPLVDREGRRATLGLAGGTLWLAGLSGSGKSTLARALEAKLVENRRPAYRLDGDNVRHGLCADLGFSDADRAENLRRVAHAAALLADAGLVVITATISPRAEHRALARRIHAQAGLPFAEVFVDAPLEVCEARDPKGLYARARRGEIEGLTGVHAPFEPPEAPDLHLRTHAQAPAAAEAALFELALDLVSLDPTSS
jgi:bifunctional enzyme CysN/CysC